MAPLSASAKGNSAARKKLIQPALPALPAVSKKIGRTPTNNEIPEPTQQLRSPIEPSPSFGRLPQTRSTPAGEQKDVFTIREQVNGIDGVAVLDNVQTSESHFGEENIAPPTNLSDTNGKVRDLDVAHEQSPAVNEQARSLPSDATDSEYLRNGISPARIGADLPTQTVPTTENIQNLESQPYESNKVQEWAEEVNDGSTQSTYSVSKDVRSDDHVNGVASLSSPGEPPQLEESDTGLDVNSQGRNQDSGIPNGDPQSYSNPIDKRSFPQENEMSYNQSTLPTITEHLIQLATTKVWADWVIMVNVQGLQPLATYAHSMVLVRSTRLQLLMQHGASNAGNHVINLFPPREILPQALEAALRFIYSDTIISEDYAFPKDATPNVRQARANSLNYILSYWSAAVEFGLAPVAARALQLLEGFFGWDVAELVMSEADELSAAAMQIAEERNTRSDYIGVAAKLRRVVLEFLSRSINAKDFKVGVTGTPSVMRSRFALLEEARLKHNPVLASMVFGSMPSSADLSPSSPQSESLPILSSAEDQTASSILLNVDFSDLEYFVNQLRQTNEVDAARIIGAVVDERENRRVKIVSNRAIPSKTRIANSSLWEVAGFREYVHDGSIRRERVGFLAPVKSK